LFRTTFGACAEFSTAACQKCPTLLLWRRGRIIPSDGYRPPRVQDPAIGRFVPSQKSNPMSGWGQDFRFALRQLRRNPGFALAVVVTLALGIGVNTAVFSLVNGFLLRPLPYPQTDHLGVLLLHKEGVLGAGNDGGEDDFHDRHVWEWVHANVPSVRAAAYGLASGVNLQAGSSHGGAIRYVREMRVSAHYFEVLGVSLFLGREFSDEEDLRGGPPSAILGFQLWQSTFQSDPKILGTTINLKGEPYTVVGVLPPHL